MDECIALHKNAQTLQARGRLLEAASEFQSCLHPACSPVLRSECASRLERLDKETPSVVFAAEAQGTDLIAVKVYNDERLLVEQLDGRPIRLNPGQHSFRFEGPGLEMARRTVVLRVGEMRRVVQISMTPVSAKRDLRRAGFALGAASALPRTNTALPEEPLPWGYLLIGTGTALAATGAAFALSAISDFNEAKRNCQPLCNPSEQTRIHTKSLLADSFFVLSGLTVALGTIHLLSERPQKRSSVALQLGPAHIIAKGSF